MVHHNKKDVAVAAGILTPILLFLIVWEGVCAYMLIVNPMQSMDNSITAIFMIIGLFAIKRIGSSLLKSIRILRDPNQT